MQPLNLRTGSTFPNRADAIALLRSIERYQPPAGQKQRVRMRILNRSAELRSPVLRPTHFAGVFLLATAASAALGGRWNQRALMASSNHELVQKQVDTPLVFSRLQKSSVTSERSADPSLHNEVSPRVETPARAVQPSEKVLVFDAMRALRREGHPERAAKLLDDYLRRYPQGSLAEEALALAIEASTALRDPKAKNLADQYLARYPAGHFLRAAEGARARFAL